MSECEEVQAHLIFTEGIYVATFSHHLTYMMCNQMYFFMPRPFSMGGHIVSPLSVCTSVPSVRPVPYVTLLVSVRYLLKGLEILYTGI